MHATTCHDHFPSRRPGCCRPWRVVLRISEIIALRVRHVDCLSFLPLQTNPHRATPLFPTYRHLPIALFLLPSQPPVPPPTFSPTSRLSHLSPKTSGSVGCRGCGPCLDSRICRAAAHTATREPLLYLLRTARHLEQLLYNFYWSDRKEGLHRGSRDALDWGTMMGGCSSGWGWGVRVGLAVSTTSGLLGRGGCGPDVFTPDSQDILDGQSMRGA